MKAVTIMFTTWNLKHFICAWHWAKVQPGIEIYDRERRWEVGVRRLVWSPMIHSWDLPTVNGTGFKILCWCCLRWQSKPVHVFFFPIRHGMPWPSRKSARQKMDALVQGPTMMTRRRMCRRIHQARRRRRTEAKDQVSPLECRYNRDPGERFDSRVARCAKMCQDVPRCAKCQLEGLKVQDTWSYEGWMAGFDCLCCIVLSWCYCFETKRRYWPQKTQHCDRKARW